VRAILLFFVAATAFGQDFSDLVPFNDLGTAPYRYGYFGGLYDDGSAVIPADHLAGGLQQASLIRPLDATGKPSPGGKIVFMSVGFGETSRIMRAMMAMAASDTRVDRGSLVMIDAARDGLDAFAWIVPMSPGNYASIKSNLLAPAGVTPKQVQAAWVELLNNFPPCPLPLQSCDAYRLKQEIASTLRELKTQYPNLRIAYLSSRVYGGYATTLWNPEPFAYESALSVRWVIMGQVEEARTGMLTWDSRISDVRYETGIAPWIAWGPYLWANGTRPRSDGLTWERDDFQADGETLSEKGARKGGALLFDFLLHEPTATWFRNPAAPPRMHAARH